MFSGWGWVFTHFCHPPSASFPFSNSIMAGGGPDPCGSHPAGQPTVLMLPGVTKTVPSLVSIARSCREIQSANSRPRLSFFKDSLAAF